MNLDTDKAQNYLRLVQDNAQPKNETLAEHRKHCKAQKKDCPFEQKLDNADNLSSQKPSSNPPEEALIYKGVSYPKSTLAFGTPLRMAFDLMKYRGNDKKVVDRELRKMISDSENWEDYEEVKRLKEVQRIMADNPSLSESVEVSKPDKRAPLQKEVTPEEWEAAKKEFGTTDNPTVMGYILPDGDGLDLSGGGTGLIRGEDHRSIDSVIERQQTKNVSYQGMVDAVLSGAIRFMPEGPGLQIGKMPTEAQFDKLYDIMDYVKQKGSDLHLDLCVDGDFDTSVSASYNPRTALSRLRSDITEFFQNGTDPKGN